MASRFSIEAIFNGVDRTSSIAQQIEKNIKRASGGIGGSLSKIGEINDKIAAGFMTIAKHAAVAGAAVGAITFAGLSRIAHTGAEFEQTITNVGAVMGKTRGQIAGLEKAALSLGVSTQFSSSEVAEAMEFMARKGFDSEEILAGIPGVLNAVAASGEGMAEVATVVGSSIRGFGLEAKQAGYVANLLAFTAEKTGAKITDMGTALAIAAPTAKALGVSIDDTAAAVGLLQKTGIDASTAGSAVATMLAKISHPSKEAADKMRAMGVAFKDAKGDMLPFRDVLAQFVKAGGKAGGTMDKMSFFADLVGLRGDKAALGLERMTKSGEFDKLLESLKNTGNYAEKVAQIRLDTTMGSWKLLTSTIDTVEIALFGLENGPLRKVIDRVNDWVKANQELIVQDVRGFIKDVAEALPKIVTWAERIGSMIGVLGGFMLAVKLATGAVILFNLIADANPWVLLAYTLAILTALVVAFWPEIKKHGEVIGAVAFVTGTLALALKGQAMWTGIVTGERRSQPRA